MLEEILKSINENLERIAKVGEESNKILKKSLDKEDTILAEPVVTAGLAQTNMQNQEFSQAQIQQPTAQAIPTAQVQESFTQEQLAVAMSNAVAAGKQDTIFKILQTLGVQALTQVSPTEYNKLAAMLKEAGVKV